VSNVPALRRPLTQSRQRNVERYLELQPSDVVFHIEASALGAGRPTAGDIISDSSFIGNTYAIIVRQREEEA
jgi:hypothetical protein